MITDQRQAADLMTAIRLYAEIEQAAARGPLDGFRQTQVTTLNRLLDQAIGLTLPELRALAVKK